MKPSEVRGTIEFRVNRVRRSDPAHDLRTRSQLNALEALITYTDREVR